MEFEALVRDAVDGLGLIGPDRLERVEALAGAYEEIARRAAEELPAMASLSPAEGARLWRTLLAGGIRTSMVLRAAERHPLIDLDSWELVHDAGRRIANATHRLVEVSADRMEARS